jgi:hypothetical protein
MKKALLVLFAAVAMAHADVEVGKPAPDFTLPSADGSEISLGDQKGKIVVLEWVNHGCPFVKKHYDSGNMQKLQKEAVADGVVWFSICSSAPGKQGHMEAATAILEATTAKGAAATAYLIDEEGTVGRLYGAKRTPEMYVIDAEGVLAYHGAIDDDPSADQPGIEAAKNHVVAALADLKAGKAVSTPETEAYGCSVKYSK